MDERDGNQATIGATIKLLLGSACPRYMVHKMDNVLSCVFGKQKEQFKLEMKSLFYQPDRQNR